MKDKLFGTDGIRGIVNSPPLTKKDIAVISRYVSLILNKVYNNQKVVIGWDTRESSLWISEIIFKEFLKAGYEVYNVGVFPTSAISFLCRDLKAIGVVVSASHNPYNFNGIKFFSPFGEKLPTKLEEEIESHIRNKIKISSLRKKGKLFEYYSQAEQKYIEFLTKNFLKDIKLEEKVKFPLVIDCANGATYKIAPKIFSNFFSNVRFINTYPDGKNINHNCGAVCPEVLKKETSLGEIGISFDGDGDRVIFIDEKNTIRDGDYVLGVLATEYKKNKILKNSLIVVSVMSNLGLLKYLWAKNIKVIQCPVGDKYVSEYLKEYKGNLGGEQAGHIVLYDYLPTGDGILTALEILKVVLKNKKKLYSLCSIFEKYPQIIKNVETTKKPPLEEIFDKDFIKNLEQKIQGRIVLRYSGTEPLFRIMVEGKDKLKIKKAADIIEEKFLKSLKKFN
ncbi:MAG: phosphoglucosamine mutase [Elusimicrobiota bacterium]|nr:phosphoglucosamine mutase [Endomicrobiia bacterium]MDW8165736.1 phosphoglucosamine mutase [Elusimicrobiota bacterium]